MIGNMVHPHSPFGLSEVEVHAYPCPRAIVIPPRG